MSAETEMPFGWECALADLEAIASCDESPWTLAKVQSVGQKMRETMADNAALRVVHDYVREALGATAVGDDMVAAADQLRQQLAAALAERERAVNWVCHNGGLLNEWAAEWRPGRETCTAYIRRRLEAAIAAGGEGDRHG